ncbi:uncharacterized protein F5891DRAFT_381954, partial [Suillus fuscotomentosus]
TSASQPRHPLSSPPTSLAPSSSPIKGTFSPVTMSVLKNPSSPNITDNGHHALDEGSPIFTTEGPACRDRRKRSHIQYTVSQVGDHDEDLEMPSKRLRTLQTTWNCSGLPSETSAYFNERMLQLSQISHQAISARMRYQRVRIHELDMIRSILNDENELAQKQMKMIESQIAHLRNALEADGVTGIGNRFDPGDYRQATHESFSDIGTDIHIPMTSESDSVVSGCADDE